MQKHTEIFCDEEHGCCFAFTEDGTRFLFDECDKELVSSRGWHLSKRGYIAGKQNRHERPLHKLMIEVDSGFDIDHINRDKTDCRRVNLRVCSHHENCFNQLRRSNNTSGFIGVSFAKNMGKFESYVHHCGHKYGLGYYSSPIEAALVRDAAAEHFFGEFCNRNFPELEVAVWLS